MLKAQSRLSVSRIWVAQGIACLLIALTGLFALAISQDWLRLAVVALAMVPLVLIVASALRIARLAFVGMFALAYLVFLLGRWIATLSSNRLYSEFSLDVTRTTLIVLFVGAVSVAVVPIGTLIAKEWESSSTRPKDVTSAAAQFVRLSWLLLFALVVCGGVRIFENAAIAREVWRYGYTQQYVSTPEFSWPAIHYLGLMYDALLAIFVAWRPRRLMLALGLGIHLVVMASSLLTGQRIYSVVWVAVLLAYVACAPPRWLAPLIRRRTTSLMIAGVALLAVGISGLSMVEHLRSGSSNSGFLESQGVSYVVIGYANERAADLPQSNGSYTFGRLVDAFTGHEPYLPNSVLEATAGDNLGATISWLVQPGVYEAGGGFGTSFVAELHTDFGLWGVGLYGILVGAALVGLSSLARRNWLTVAVCLLLARSLIIMPRDFALNWVFPFLSFSVLIPLVSMAAIAYAACRYDRRA